MPFTFEPTEIPDVVHIVPRLFGDERGSFSEFFKRSEFEQHGLPGNFVQINYSSSKQNVLRGLHYQLNPDAQGKLVTVVEGNVFDVAVDIREGSPTYGKWVGKYLTGDEHNMLYIPPGFAHGYYVVSESAQFMYGCTSEYAPTSEGGIIWNDPNVGIEWPATDPIIAERDAAYPTLADAKHNFVYG